MSGTRKGWIVAASIGAVEALKDQGFCRWNYALRSLQQHAKSKIKLASYYNQADRNQTASASSSTHMRDDEKRKKTEESIKKVMHLSCWGPNTVRF